MRVWTLFSFSFQDVIHHVGSVWVQTPQTARSVSNRKRSCCLKMDMSLTGPVCLPVGQSITLTLIGPAEVSKQEDAFLYFFSEDVDTYATIIILSSSLIMKWWQDKCWKMICLSLCWGMNCRLFALVIPNVLILDDWRYAVHSRYTRAVVQDVKHPVENAVHLKFKSWPNPAKKDLEWHFFKVKRICWSFEKSTGVSHHTQTQKWITLKQYENSCL